MTKLVRIGDAENPHRVLGLPDEATDKDIAAAIAHFRTTPEFDALLDKTTGAPSRVRALVGASPTQDRLATPLRFYPGAERYGEPE